MQDHGGNLDQAIARYGGTKANWIDLSTGINPCPYPVGNIPANAWATLPTREAYHQLVAAAQIAYGTTAPLMPVAGAQAAIQMIPFLRPPADARIIGPTYNEYAGTLRAAGWHVTDVHDIGALAGCDLAIIVNPNNPDGRQHKPDNLRAISQDVGLLVVDESFADPLPHLSLATDPGNALVLRSFGKFFGLAGLRLGFCIGPDQLIARLGSMAGPWPVSGPAIDIANRALTDKSWQRETVARLEGDARRLDDQADGVGWSLVGGTTLYRLFDTHDAEAMQDRLAQHHIWSRRFPYSKAWIRLGLPGEPDHWSRLAAALG